MASRLPPPTHPPRQRYSKGLRVAEMNSISNNGRRGVSDTMGGALWALDAALEVAATGATGVNFHCAARRGAARGEGMGAAGKGRSPRARRPAVCTRGAYIH